MADGRIVVDIGDSRKTLLKTRLEYKKKTLTDWIKAIVDRFIKNTDVEIVQQAFDNEEIRNEVKDIVREIISEERKK